MYTFTSNGYLTDILATRNKIKRTVFVEVDLESESFLRTIGFCVAVLDPQLVGTRLDRFRFFVGQFHGDECRGQSTPIMDLQTVAVYV